MKIVFARFIIASFLIFPLLFSGANAWAQLPGVSPTPAPTAEAAPLKSSDPLGRDTPAGLATHFLAELAREDYKSAANYLDLSSLPKADQASGPELAKNLQYLLDQSGSIRISQLSTQPTGKLDDGLAADREKMGTLRLEDESIDLLARRLSPANSPAIWLIAPETVAKIPALMSEVEISPLNKILPPSMVKKKWLGIPIGHWLALIILAPIAYLIVYFVTLIYAYIVRTAHQVWQRKYENNLLLAFIGPVRLFFSAMLFIFAAHFMGVSIIARQYFGRGAIIIAWVSLGWLAQRIVDVFANAGKEQLYKYGHNDAISALMFFRRSIKVALVAIAAMAVLDTLGVNVSAGLAALGIGGIAVALGAQKTVENLIGGLSLVLDRPIRIGDFCRFGTLMGTVEDIGMRSIRLRTPDRTVVTVPNGEFATLQIENFSSKDKLYFHPFIQLRYDTTPDQIQAILTGIRTLVKNEPKAEQPGSYVNFVGITDRGSHNIEISFYTLTVDYDEYRAIGEKFLLGVLDIIKQNKTALAVPYNVPAPVVIVEQEAEELARKN